MKYRNIILLYSLILFQFTGKAVAENEGFASLSNIFKESDIIVKFRLSLGFDDKSIPDRSYGPIGIIGQQEIFYASSSSIKNSIAKEGRFYFWRRGPNPPNSEDWKALEIDLQSRFYFRQDYIAFLKGPMDFPKPIELYREEVLFDENDQAFLEKEYIHDVESAFVPVLHGFGRVVVTSSTELAGRDARSREISEFIIQRNQDSMKKLYGTIDRLAIRGAFAEVFASYPDMPSGTILEEKGEDFSVAATRIHEALVEAFGKEGLRRLESGVLVPAEDEAADEESE